MAGGATWTYADIVDHANRLAHVLGDAGVAAGEPVALAISNRAEWIVADQAIIRAGAAKVPINDMLSAPEIEYILGDCGAKVALVDSALMARVAGADAPGLTVLICVDGAPARRSAGHRVGRRPRRGPARRGPARGGRRPR